jgi:hypothetical protein
MRAITNHVMPQHTIQTHFFSLKRRRHVTVVTLSTELHSADSFFRKYKGRSYTPPPPRLTESDGSLLVSTPSYKSAIYTLHPQAYFFQLKC